ncbi:MAG: GNAT family N-acetyltransferase [Pseudomonadota bacterium]
MSSRTCTFRYPSPLDAVPLVDFASRCFVATYDHQNTPDNIATYLAEHFQPSVFERLLRSRSHLVMTMWLDEALAGYAVAQRSVDDDGTYILDIERFYVASDYHGGGYAGPFMEALDRSAAALDVERLRLGVYTENPRAIAFYRKQGFEIIGEQTFTFGSEAQRDWVMARSRRSPAFTDTDFIAAFLDGAWPAAAWTHAAHVRLAWTLLAAHSFEETLKTVKAAIARYNRVVLASDAYHETLTQAFVTLVASEFRADEAFTAFCQRASALLSRSPFVVEHYYSPELLASDEAKRRFVEPDRATLPPPVVGDNRSRLVHS